MSDTPKSILAELALHLSYDADVNGSKSTKSPIGRLPLADSPYTLWKRICDVQQDSSLEQKILMELVEELDTNAESIGNPPRRVGNLSLQTREGSLWKRTLDVLGYEPDMIRDVVASAIKTCLAK